MVENEKRNETQQARRKIVQKKFVTMRYFCRDRLVTIELYVSVYLPIASRFRTRCLSRVRTEINDTNVTRSTDEPRLPPLALRRRIPTTTRSPPPLLPVHVLYVRICQPFRIPQDGTKGLIIRPGFFVRRK